MQQSNRNSRTSWRTMRTLIVLIISISAAAITSTHPSISQSPQDAQKSLVKFDMGRTSDEWMQVFECGTSADSVANESFRIPLTDIWSRIMHPCRRDKFSWRYKYIDEQRAMKTIYIKDRTVDERLSNALHILNLNNMFDTSYTFFNSGDPKRDARNELAVAGPEVDDAKCASELAHMSQLFDELQTELNEMRAAEVVNQTFHSSSLQMGANYLRLARVLDSYGRYESGALDGKLRLVGAYDECEGARLLNKEGEDVRMRYCVANMNFDRDLHPVYKARTRYPHETAHTQLSVGSCLPRSCHSRNFHSKQHKQLVQKFVDSQLRLPSSIYVHQNYKLDSVFCMVDKDSEYGKIPLGGKACLFFGACWLLLCTWATLASKYPTPEQDKEKLQHQPSFIGRLMKHFDLSQSWRDLISDRRHVDPNEPVDLDALNPVKIFACHFCVATHVVFMFGSVASSQVQIAEMVDSSTVLQVALLTSTVIDTFFVISGLLVTYVTLLKINARYRARSSALLIGGDRGHNQSGLSSPVESNSGSRGRENNGGGVLSFMVQWLAIASNRYLRIVPLYAILFWFRRDVLTYLGYGPLWDYGLNKETPAGACAQEPWWVPFTSWTAFVPLAKQCFIPSWSISNDITFGVLLPPLIIMYLKRPRFAIGGAIALSLVLLLVTIEGHLIAPPGLLWELLEGRLHGILLLFTGLSHLYSYPIYRASSFIVGSLAGYYLFKFNLEWRQSRENGNISDERNSPGSPTPSLTRWPAWFTGIATQWCWLFLITHFLVGIFTNEIRNIIDPYHRPIAFYWFTLDRFLWSISNAIIFLRMVTDWRHNSMMQAFARQRWRTIAKLNYPLVFIHWIVIVLFLGFLPSPASFTMWQNFAAYAAVALTALPLSTIVHVMFENPLDKFVKREIFGN